MKFVGGAYCTNTHMKSSTRVVTLVFSVFTEVIVHATFGVKTSVFQAIIIVVYIHSLPHNNINKKKEKKYI